MNQTIQTTPKDFFINLGAIIALYSGVVSLMNLSFSIINYYFPDSLSGYFYTSSIAWPISMLVVVTPIFYFLERYIVKDILMVPEKSYMWIRRWGIFLTLFLTGIIIAGDLITLINTYLNGEISARFIWKVFAVLIISATVFKYYFFTINTKYQISAFARTFHAWLGLVLVIVAIATGFLAVGSPTKQRAMRFDNQRIDDLQNIQWQVVSYWQQKGKLPATLSDLKDPISNTFIPVDPENKSAYEYLVKGDKAFQLCGNFTLDSSVNNTNTSYPAITSNDNWKYTAGKSCFDRTIDSEKYPPTPKPVKL